MGVLIDFESHRRKREERSSSGFSEVDIDHLLCSLEGRHVALTDRVTRHVTWHQSPAYLRRFLYEQEFKSLHEAGQTQRAVDHLVARLLRDL